MKRWAGVTLAALTVLSLTANILLFQRGQQYYLELNATRLDPLGLNAFDGATVAHVEPLVVFFGDSRTASWPAPSIPGWAFENRGLGAQTTAQVLGRLEAHLGPLKPRVVIVQVGINDLKTLPLFPERSEAIIARCLGNLSAIIQGAEATGATVLVTTIFPVGEAPLIRRPFWSEAVGEGVETVNASLRALATERVMVFDAYALLQRDGQLRAEYAQDELHINAAGYAALNEGLIRLLAEVN
jgi:lysophospholipase L1-like esterase